MTSSQYSFLSIEDKSAMFKKYCQQNLSIYYGNGKRVFLSANLLLSVFSA